METSFDTWKVALYEDQFNADTGEIYNYGIKPSPDSEDVSGSVLSCLLESPTRQDFNLGLEKLDISVKEEINWTDSAVTDLFSLTETQGKLFHTLAKNLVTRNIVFIDNTSLCSKSGISRDNLSKSVKSLESTGNIVEVSKSECCAKRNLRVIFLNPTIVWKGYYHRGGKNDSDGHYYSSKYRFSSLHDHYVQQWVRGYFHELAGKPRENRLISKPAKECQEHYEQSVFYRGQNDE